MKTRSKPTPKAVTQALELMRLIAEPTPRENAERRMREAKAAFTVAAKLALSGDAKAEDAARNAFAEVNAARAQLQSLGGQE